MLRLLSVLAVVCAASCQSEQNGSCGTPNAVANVDIRSILGNWYQIERIPNVEMGVCSRLLFGMYNLAVGYMDNWEMVEGAAISWRATVIAAPDMAQTGRFIIYFGGVAYNYYVLTTDYRSYAVLYSCQDTFNNTKSVSAWKLSRTTSLSPAAEEQIAAAVSRNPELQLVQWSVTEQNC